MTICRDRQEITLALIEVRHRRGLSQEALDDLAGFTSGYTSKLECAFSPARNGESRRTGRCAMHGTFDEWLGALGIGFIGIPDVQHKAWRTSTFEAEIALLESILTDLKRAQVRNIGNRVKKAQREGIKVVRT